MTCYSLGVNVKNDLRNVDARNESGYGHEPSERI